MKKVLKVSVLICICLMLIPSLANAKGGKGRSPELELEVINAKSKGTWLQVGIAIQNLGTADTTISCCNSYIEDGDGYAIAALKRDELMVLIHNKAQTAATIGALIGLGLGIGGAVSNNDALEYAGIAVGSASMIGGIVGGAVAEGQQRNLIIDDIMRNRTFPAGLKVAGFVFFPPVKKWPGSSRVAKMVHVTYEMGGKTYKVSAPITDEAFKKIKSSYIRNKRKFRD